MSYALVGAALILLLSYLNVNGKLYTQTDGLASYAWLAITGTIAFLLVYILTDVAAAVFA